MASSEDFDFLFQEADAFALPLLDFDPDEALLSPAEQQALAADPSSPVSTDDGSTDAETASPPPQFELLQAVGGRTDTSASSPAARSALLGAKVTHSPLPSEQKLLAPRSSGGLNGLNGPTSQCNVGGTSHGSPVDASATNSSIKQMESKALQPSPTFQGSLPYALPVAYFPALNANQKRPFPQVLPGAVTTNGPAATATATADPNAKKSKREIRQMKNRESANKSRLRRKAQLSSLSAEVAELTKKQQELQTVIAGLRAENKSLHDQNAFLRSLVTGCKQEPSTNQLAAFSSLPPLDEGCVALNVLESGQKMDVDVEGQAGAGVDFAPTRPSKRRAVTSTLSTASMAVCASVFGITVFADYDGGAAASSTVRGVGRVLHEAPAACGVAGCTSSGSSSLVGFVVSWVSSWWRFVSSSQLVFGVLLNVLSFIAIMAVYQLWQSRSAGTPTWKYAMLSRQRLCGARRQAEFSVISGSYGDEKKQSKSAREVRQRDKLGRGKCKA